MSDNLYSYEFKEYAEDYTAGYTPSTLPSYEEATGVNSEAPITVEFPEPRLIFPEPDFIIKPPEVHTTNIKDIPVKISNSGVTSHEALLNNDPNVLHSFFLHHNTAPQLFVDIQGYHYKYTKRRVRVVKPDGRAEWKTRKEKKKVVDFAMNYDASQFILPTGILHLRDPESHLHEEDCTINGMSELFTKYIQSTNHLKEIRLEKIIQWEFEELTRAISYAIRSQGYRGKIVISYRRENYKVKVISQSTLAKLYHSKVMSALCVLTCCCIVFWPIAHMYKDKMGEDFRSTFQMSISTQEWYYQNISSILSKTENR